MKKNLLFLCFLLIVPLFNAQSDSLYSAIQKQREVRALHKALLQNPAIMPDFGNFPISEVKLGYHNENRPTHLWQTPEGLAAWDAGVTSYYPMKKDLFLWGSASYRNEDQKKLVWNESLDYDLIYPYITADSVGGNLHLEQYSFSGGAAIKKEKLSYGVNLDYAAKLGSRSVDPRPKDISSHLKLNGGLSFNYLSFATVGLSAGISKYTQSNDIKFFSEIGQPSIYHFNGLGFYNNLLKGDKTQAFYDGAGLNAGMQLIGRQNHPWHASVGFSRLKIDKIVNDIADIEASQVINTKIEAQITKLWWGKRSQKGVSLYYQSDEKKGIESVLAGRNAPDQIIARRDNFELKHRSLGLKLIHTAQNPYVSITPYIQFEEWSEKNIYPPAYQRFRYIISGISAEKYFNISIRSFLETALALAHTSVFNQQTLFENISEESIRSEVFKTSNIFNANRLRSQVDLRYVYRYNSDLHIFAGVGLQAEFLRPENNFGYSLSTGFYF